MKKKENEVLKKKMKFWKREKIQFRKEKIKVGNQERKTSALTAFHKIQPKDESFHFCQSQNSTFAKVEREGPLNGTILSSILILTFAKNGKSPDLFFGKARKIFAKVKVEIEKYILACMVFDFSWRQKIKFDFFLFFVLIRKKSSEVPSFFAKP